MHREDFLVDDEHFYIDVYLEEGPTTMDPVFIVSVTVEEGDEVVREKDFQFTSEEETKQFIEDLKEQKIDLL